MRALARRPEDRFATAGQFLEALRLAHAQPHSDSRLTTLSP
jgi:hypothetical protein